MDLSFGRPFEGRALEKLKSFLKEAGLSYDEAVSYSVCLFDGGDMVATGSLDGNVLKCIAVREDRQGENLTATVVTELYKEAFAKGEDHLFLFTKPQNLAQFSGLSFYAVARTDDVLLMENRRDGAVRFVRDMAAAAGIDVKAAATGRIGAAVMNCNPFTMGHRFLVERAAAECDRFYVFVVSEERSMFSAAARLELVRAGTRDLRNVNVFTTGPYMVSTVTFPTYFLKDSSRAEGIAMELDLAVFSDVFANELGINARYVGTEPFSPVTEAYNRAMKLYLPRKGIQVVEVPRLETDGSPVSATTVRRYIESGNLDAVRPLVPTETYEYILTHRKKEEREHAVL